MLHYSKIPGSKNCPAGRCIAFEKYDGTNLHWEWERELGWHSFGTRRDAFDLDEPGGIAFAEAHPQLHGAPALFLASLAAPLASVFAQPEYAAAHSISVFTEFLGPRSFAGLHREDDLKELRLFDVRLDGRFVAPHEFVADFGHVSIARVVYQGQLTGEFAEGVRHGKYGVAEGVVCKGVHRGEVWMAKIKTSAYLAKLKQAFADQWEEYWE
jgi:hypothetical protein